MITEEMKQVVNFYNQGLELYKDREFQKALKLFQEALKIKPNDTPSKLYETRCLEFIKNPPPMDWDGVYVMKTK
ncbi:MAG: tetratricopeptide repeat protein [Leptospiraceae bacterium]|nr:tetratricopeptide repeat protein [Leptospiraceae bacterium]MCP5494599.1 tetratricopeptide repeat protein [Leptospiraceae bacterium]